jgi:hypothetical protein
VIGSSSIGDPVIWRSGHPSVIRDRAFASFNMDRQIEDRRSPIDVDPIARSPDRRSTAKKP